MFLGNICYNVTYKALALKNSFKGNPMTNLTQTVIQSFVANFEATDKSSKALFSGYYNKAKIVRDNKKALNELKAEYKTTLRGLTQNEAIIKRFDRILNLADNYIKLDIFVHFDSLYFYNIESLTNLMTYMTKNVDNNTVKTINKRVTKVFDKNDSVVVYNNKMNATIQEIKKEYNIIDTERGFIQLETQINKLAYSLSKEQKESLIKLLQDSIK